MQPCLENNTSFFAKLQQAEGLDLRDNRGKRHDLAVVLIGVVLALLSNRDGSLSSVHRHLQKRYGQLMAVLGLKSSKAVSRSQLPIILEKVSVEVFDQLLFAHYGLKLSEEQRKWFAVDGKELRGSIQTGAKRGEAVVQVIEHETGQFHSQSYYAGDKESEVPAVRSLLKDGGLCADKISLDALHCRPKTLAPIVAAGGIYLVGLKQNQKEMFLEVQAMTKHLPYLYQTESLEKGHGRIEHRKSQVYDIATIYQDERWDKCKIATVVKVKRERHQIKSGKQSLETSYYLSNETQGWEQLCAAVRKHWSVEINNHIRDVTLKEDQMRSKKDCKPNFSRNPNIRNKGFK